MFRGSSTTHVSQGVLRPEVQRWKKHALKITITRWENLPQKRWHWPLTHPPPPLKKKNSCFIWGSFCDVCILGKKLPDGRKGLGGVGGLTTKRIDSMQGWYGQAIRNKGDAKAMSKATHAIWKHCSSTLENPNHSDCPTGKSSWCSLQRDIANGIELHRPYKHPLTPAIVDAIQPIFESLGDERFLAGCEQCLTQNQNESLHHVIWSLAPKEQYNSPAEIDIATNLGVLLFNRGYASTYMKLFPKIGLVPPEEQVEAWKKLDKEQVNTAEYQSSEEVKIKRNKLKRSKVKKQDAFVRAEGVMYKSQAFHQTGKKPKAKKATSKKGSTKKSCHDLAMTKFVTTIIQLSTAV